MIDAIVCSVSRSSTAVTTASSFASGATVSTYARVGTTVSRTHQPTVATGTMQRAHQQHHERARATSRQRELAPVTKAARSLLCWSRDGSWTYIMCPAS